ncbi:MAG TPA: MBL fold metallo-hydrolase [Vicinamibacterales bacterium]|jgi:glyoxylase-like metal-dependent hydrolase (beta-lactamase superfamily II)
MKPFAPKLSLLSAASVVLLAAVLGPATFVYPQDARNRGDQAASGAPALELLHIRGNVSMLAGAGANITVQVGSDGVLLVDSGTAPMTDKVLEAIRTLSKGQVTYIVNTNDRSDHIGGNANFARLGRPLAIARAAQARVFIIGFSSILERMSDRNLTPPIPEQAWPNDTYSGPQKNLSFNGDGIQIFHQPATTDGDSIVMFRRADVVATGDIFDPTQYPIIDLKSGGSFAGVLEGLNRLRQMAIPADHMEGGTMIVPGHGRLSDIADLDIYHQMITIVRDRLQDMIKRGMTLEQVKAAKPTRDYDPIYGRDTGNWTTDMFIEAAYRSLSTQRDTSGRASN